MVNFNTFAGRSFLGLGNLLTGAKVHVTIIWISSDYFNWADIHTKKDLIANTKL